MSPTLKNKKLAATARAATLRQPEPITKASSVFNSISLNVGFVPAPTDAAAARAANVLINEYLNGVSPSAFDVVPIGSYALGPAPGFSQRYTVAETAPGFGRLTTAASEREFNAVVEAATTVVAADSPTVTLVPNVASLAVENNPSTGYSTLSLNLNGSEGVLAALFEDPAIHHIDFAGLQFEVSGLASVLAAATGTVAYYNTHTVIDLPEGLAEVDDMTVTRFAFGSPSPTVDQIAWVSSTEETIFIGEGCRKRTIFKAREILNAVNVAGYWSNLGTIPNVAFSQPNRHGQRRLLYIYPAELSFEAARGNATTQLFGFVAGRLPDGRKVQNRGLLNVAVASKLQEQIISRRKL